MLTIFLVFLSILKQIPRYCLDLAATTSIQNHFQFISPAILSCIVQAVAMNHSKMMNTEQVGSSGNTSDYIWEVLSSNLGLDTGYPDRKFSVLSPSPSPLEYQDSALNWAAHTPLPHPF
jgi:hypothetical protein